MGSGIATLLLRGCWSVVPFRSLLFHKAPLCASLDSRAEWLCVCVMQDPFPKPCYLFALVAGDLVMKEDSFTTSSGRKVVLRIYTQPANINQVCVGG